MIVFHRLRRPSSVVQALSLVAVPHGGQRGARRNAWASMSADAALARSRREAEAAMDRSVSRAATRAAHPAGSDLRQAR